LIKVDVRKAFRESSRFDPQRGLIDALDDSERSSHRFRDHYEG